MADRSWGTVREDYSSTGNVWAALTYDEARCRAFRWGEDGIAGLCDRYQLLCFAPAFWNGNDHHLKERFFGVTPLEGNHGEDVKDYYFHVDNLPSHAFMVSAHQNHGLRGADSGSVAFFSASLGKPSSGPLD